MKKLEILFLLTIFLLACKKDKQDKMLNEPFDTSQATLVSKANFSSNAHPTSGCVNLYQKSGSYFLEFEGFKTDKGPDLRVYLSKAANNTNFIELGTLKANNGNFYYSLPNTILLPDYKYVLIWCEDFSVLFGNALLN